MAPPSSEMTIIALYLFCPFITLPLLLQFIAVRSDRFLRTQFSLLRYFRGVCHCKYPAFHYIEGNGKSFVSPHISRLLLFDGFCFLLQ